MRIERSSFLKAVVLLVALANVGMWARAQQQAPQPAVLTPESLSIPEQPPSPPPSSLLQNYRAVTAERLKQPADGEWLMVRRTYDGWGYSPLDQINAKNVSRLQPVWTMSTGMNNGHEAAPLVNGGVMFVSTSFNQVLALDAKSGDVLWRYQSAVPTNARGKPVSRGVALFGDKVFVPLGEAALVALEAKTGKEVWRTAIGDNAAGAISDSAAARSRRQAGRRHCRRGRREPGFRRCLRSRYRPPVMENLHDAGAGRAGKRDVAGRRLANRRRGDVGDGQLRS